MALNEEQVLKMRAQYGIGIPKAKDQGFMQGFMDSVRGIGSDIKETGEGIGGQIKAGGERLSNIAESDDPLLSIALQGGANAIQTVGGVVAETALGGAKALVPQAVEDKVASGVESLAASEPVQEALTMELSPEAKEFFGVNNIAEMMSQDPTTEAGRNVKASLGGLFGALEVTGLKGAGALAKSALAVANKGRIAISDLGKRALADSKEALGKVEATGAEGVSAARALGIEPEQIMQRVARISKGQQAKFEGRFNESIGSYLVGKKIFGDVDHISDQLFKTFTTSKGNVDNALASLPGQFKSTAYGSAIKQLKQREMSISSPGAKSPDLERVVELEKISKGKGLSFSEMNEVKRLFERNVRLDFVKENLPTKVAAATNLDKAMREFQFEKASAAGFKNLPELNMETAKAKFLMDEIGKEYAGAAGNNNVSLTDWLLLAEATGNPAAAGGFVVKKAASSKGIQSALAKYLSQKQELQGVPEAKIEPFVSDYLDFLESNKASFKQGENPTTKDLPLTERLVKANDFTSPEGVKGTTYSIDGDSKLGNVIVETTKNGLVIRNILIDSKLRGQGLGTEIYISLNAKSLKETGKPLRSINPERTLESGVKLRELSEDAVALWESLVKKGLATKRPDGGYVFKANNKS